MDYLDGRIGAGQVFAQVRRHGPPLVTVLVALAALRASECDERDRQPSAPRVPRMGPLRVLAFRSRTMLAPSLACSRQSVVLRRLPPAYLTKLHRRVLPRAAPATAGGHDEFWPGAPKSSPHRTAIGPGDPVAAAGHRKLRSSLEVRRHPTRRIEMRSWQARHGWPPRCHRACRQS